MVKRIVETPNESLLDQFIGEKVLIYCCRFIYEGTLAALNGDFIELSGTRIVYDTGSHDKSKDWAAVEACWNEKWIVSIASIESMGKV